MEDNENQEVIAYIKFYSEIKKVILTPTFEELKKKICNLLQINEDSFNFLKLSYKDEDNDIITVSSEEDYNILLAQIKNKEVDILNIESEEDGNIDINACSHSIIKFHENIDKEDNEEEKKNDFDIISSQQFEINKEEKKENQKNNIVIDSIQSSRIEINENNQDQLKNKNNFDFQKNDNDLKSPYLQNDINDNNINNINNFNKNNINTRNNINNININNNMNNNNLSSQTYMVFPLSCNLCSQYPIVKILYYCLVCNIPLCEECEDKLGINHRHSILKVQTNQQFEDLNLRINSCSKGGNSQSNNNKNNNDNKNSPNENQSQIMNIFNNIKDSVISGIFGDDKKNENINNINQEVNNKNEQIVPQRMSLIQLARAQYDLNGVSDNQLQEAIEKTNGNIDEAVILLMQ